ncbi:MAG: hypothetical protein U1E30_19855, partial [Rhodoblastus sp.]
MSRLRRREFAALAAAGLAAPWAVQAEEAQRTKVLRYSFPIAETGFDPARVDDIYSQIITAHVFDGLYRYDYLAR